MSTSSEGKPADRKPLPDLKLAGLVHDLNNVFQTLVDVADVLSHESSDPQSAKLAAAILRTVDRGKNITLDLQGRSASRSEAESSEDTPPEGTQLDKIVANAIAFIEDSQIAGRGPKVRFACELEAGLVLGSGRIGRWAWERVFINLFVNSVRAMPTGGTVTIAARRRTPGQIEIFVRDQGCGIAPEVQDRLFEPHVSASASTGLGLHIVKTIVESDGGYVSASNLEGKPGAEFMITLPARTLVAENRPVLLASPAHA